MSATQAVTAELWRARLQTSRQGEPLGNLHNAIVALEGAPQLAGLVGLNTFDQRVWQLEPAPWDATFTARPWVDTSDSELQTWLQAEGVQVASAETIHRAVNTVAKRHEFHPIREYFDSIFWDHKPRLTNWLSTYLGATDSDYSRTVGRKFLIGAIARAYEPGCKFDTMLVLEGPQGFYKSETVRILGHPWVSESLPDVGTKDAMQQLHGAWIIEIAELSAVRHKEIETVKSFISRRVDRFRPPYQRRVDDFPRQCAFIGTTNENEYLLDTTGNRRFWPVACTHVRIDELAEDRDQLMAEALAAYRDGEPWHFTDDDESRKAAREQELRRVQHPWEETLVPYLETLAATMKNPSVSARRLLDELDIPEGKRTAWDSRRVSDIARAQGWVSTRTGKSNERVFTKPKGRQHATA